MAESSTTHSERVVVEWDGEWWTVSDEDGEFAKATEVEQALSYVRDLMYGPGTGATTTALWQMVHGKTERLRDDEPEGSGPFGF